MQRLARLLASGCLLLALAVLSLAVPPLAFPSLAAQAVAAPAVQMQVQASGEGVAKPDGWTTVFVELTSLGEDLEGELVVEATVDRSHPQYVVPVSLAAGEKKRIPVSLIAAGEGISVRLYASGEQVARQDVPIASLPVGTALIGLLAEGEPGIPALDQLPSAPSNPVQVIRLDAGTFPDRIALLEDYNVIAIARFDTAALSPEQLRTLEGWVARGGTLLLIGGPDWQRTLSPLPASLRPVQVTGVRDVPLDPLADLGGQELTGTGTVSTAEVLRGQAVVQSDGVPLIVSSAFGSGRILYTAFDPGLAPAAEWAGQATLFGRLLGAPLQPTVLWKESGHWSIRGALQEIPDWALPSLWLVGLLLVGYLLLVGPVNYLVLKRLDRREWAWVSVPVLALLSMGVVYVIGSGRYNPLVSHLITVTELSPGSQVATVHAYVGLYSPSQREVSAEVGGSPLVRAFSWQTGGRERVLARVVAGEATRVDMLDMSSYQVSAFWAQEDVTLGGGLELVDARLEGDKVTGRVRNTLDVPVLDVVLASGDSHVPVGRLEPGQTSDPVTLTLPEGSGRPVWFPFYYGGYEDIRRPSVEEERRRRILDMVYDELRNENRAGLLLLGWTEQPVAAPELSVAGKRVEGANLVYTVLPIPAEGKEGIPPGVILGHPTDLDAADRVPGAYLLRPGRTEFTILLPPMDMTRVESISLEGLPPVEEDIPIQVFVKNQETGEWIPVIRREYSLPDWRTFVSPAGVIELLYEAQAHGEIPAPTVAVRGVSD